MSSITNTYPTKDVGTSPVAVYTAGVGKSGVCLGGNIANLLDVSISVDVFYRRTANSVTIDYYYVRGATIPPNTSFVFTGTEQKINVDSGDSIVVKSSSAASCDVLLFVAEIG